MSAIALPPNKSMTGKAVTNINFLNEAIVIPPSHVEPCNRRDHRICDSRNPPGMKRYVIGEIRSVQPSQQPSAYVA